MTSEQKLEILLDRIADALILSPLVDENSVKNAQKYIRNGQLKQGSGSGVLALFQKDIRANKEDLINSATVTTDDGTVQQNLQQIVDSISHLEINNIPINIIEGADNTISISLSNVGDSVEPIDITSLLIGDGNPLNVSQFIPLKKSSSIVDIEKAEEFLDTNIFELLPSGDTRQARIIRLFQELNALLPPNPPEFDLNNDGIVDRDDNGNWSGQFEYTSNNSISYAQEYSNSQIDEEEAFIHRIKSGPYAPNSTNLSRTIQDIYDRVLPYLTDILEEPITPQDDRPEYRNESAGYLKFRNPNQGIIIRNTNQQFIEGLEPDNPTWLTSEYNRLLSYDGNNVAQAQVITEYPGSGFTITMWVRFLDKVSNGTLFNFGNPTREENPFGFKLETFVINKDDTYNDGNGNIETFEDYIEGSYHENTLGLFQNTNTERFVRLQVREFGDFATGNDEGLRDSAVGMGGIRKFKFNPPDLNKNNNGQDYYSDDERRILNYTHIPENFSEWYFICATYNPTIQEYNSDFDNTNPLYWLNHINSDGTLTTNSGRGNKCKVEIISRSDLLRARGFKVD